MPIEVTVPGSPGWWLKRLGDALSRRQDTLNLLDSYYEGNPPLPEGAQSARDAYRKFQRKARANYAKLVVEPVRQRMIPQGFRTGAEGDATSDRDAWRLWQANELDAEASILHRAMLTMGDAYAIVGAPDGDDIPVITVEDPRQVITAHDPIRRRRVIAALKVFADDIAEADRAYLYLPGEVWRASRRRRKTGMRQWDMRGWEWEGDPDGLPFRQPPVVRFPNQPRINGATVGEFAEHLDVLDRINHGILQRLMIATLQAFRQRAVKNVPLTDADGNEIDYDGIFTADAGALWLLPDGADLWESGQVDLNPILASVRDDVKELAASTQTPLYLLSSDATNQSAEGAALAREGLVAKVEERRAVTSEAWEQVMSLAFRWLDDPRADMVDMEVLWGPAERVSIAERYDAATKAQAAGVPWRTTMTSVLQFSPQEVDRMEGERALDTFLAPPAPTATPAT